MSDQPPRDEQGRFTNADGSFMTVGQMMGADLLDYINRADEAKKQADEELFGALGEAYKQRAEDEELERAKRAVSPGEIFADDPWSGYE